MLKKIFSHSFIYAVAPNLPKIVGILMLPIITKFLSTSDYGIWGVILAYTGLLYSIKDLGMVQPMVNIFFRHSKWKYSWQILQATLMIWSVITVLLQSLILHFVLPVQEQHNEIMILILMGLPVLLFDVPILFGTRYFQLTDKPLFVGINAFVSGITSVVITYYTIVVLKMGYMGWVTAMFCSSLISAIIYAYFLYIKLELYPFFIYRKNFLKSCLKVGLPTIPHNYSTFLLNASDRVVMDILKVNVNDMGLYNVAYTFGNYFEIFGGAIGMAVSPIYTKMLAGTYKENPNIIRLVTFFLQLLFIVLTVIIALWCKELFAILFKNKDLQAAYPMGVIIIMSYSFRPMYWAIVNKLGYFEKTQHLWKLSLIAGIINIALNFICIPIWGFKSAVYITFFSLMYMGFAGFFLKEYKSISSMPYYPLYWLLLILVCTLCIILLKDATIIRKVTASALIIISAGFLLKGMQKNLKKLMLNE